MRYRFTLERYKGARTRYACPNCGKPGEFTRYVDTGTGKHVADHVGRCNREVNCGYHYTPKRYFADNGTSFQKNNHGRTQAINWLERAPQPISLISFETFRRSLTGYAENAFVRYLHNLFDADTTSELIRRFYMGTSYYWRGATVFWQVDIRGRIRTGKIMLYEPAAGRRVKEILWDGSNHSKITWAHSLLQKRGEIQDFNLRQCLFGEHQLAAQPKTKPVAVVESEKTAIIATAYLPSLVWLACGSSTNLTADRCRVLAGRKVVLFPDLNCFEKWKARAKHLQALLDCSISVSGLLEREASEADRAKGYDLADYLIRNEPVRESGGRNVNVIS